MTTFDENRDYTRTTQKFLCRIFLYTDTKLHKTEKRVLCSCNCLKINDLLYYTQNYTKNSLELRKMKKYVKNARKRAKTHHLRVKNARKSFEGVTRAREALCSCVV